LEPTQFHTGKVVIVGAGPGDPELLTLKALRHLAKADVVLTDRLANPDILQSFAPKAIVVPVGKQCRKDKSTPQATINELLVHHAKAGRYVVRLKGGDISVFSNILDELDALVNNNIPYELVPGITAALGTAAYAGVPLTARGFSKGVRFITYYNAEAIANSDWENLAQTTDTLVFYMSGDTCFELANKLMSHGKSASTPILLAEQSTTLLQQFKLSSLMHCREAWQHHQFLSPTLLIVGEVAVLHEKYAWLKSNENANEFFDPILFKQSPPTATATSTTISIS
jgi:uroporphyrin-III C-methyltransferase/precorrin-2 dehydrogenase/sirohydrochlorin ferrochelatase/uroporphyrin-III C-methyltransferase